MSMEFFHFFLEKTKDKFVEKTPADQGQGVTPPPFAGFSSPVSKVKGKGPYSMPVSRHHQNPDVKLEKRHQFKTDLSPS